MAIKAMNGAQQARDGAEEAVEPEAPPEPSAEEKLLTEIRDLLAAKQLLSKQIFGTAITRGASLALVRGTLRASPWFLE